MRWPPWRSQDRENRAREALRDAKADAALLAQREPLVRDLIRRADKAADRAETASRAKSDQRQRNHLSDLFGYALREGL